LSWLVPNLLLLFLWLEKRAFFTHETIRMDLPPGAEIEVEIVPAVPGHVQWNFAMTFGDLVNPLVEIEHSHPTMMKTHLDPLYYSIVRWIYPLNIKVRGDRPHKAIIRNKDTTTQTIEVTFWLIEMDKEVSEELEKVFKGYFNLLIEKAGKETEKVT